MDPETMQRLVLRLDRELDDLVTLGQAAELRRRIANASGKTGIERTRALRRILTDPWVHEWTQRHVSRPESRDVYKAREGDAPARYLIAECPATVRTGAFFSLDVSISANSGTAEYVRPFAVPVGGANVRITVQVSPRRGLRGVDDHFADVKVPAEDHRTITRSFAFEAIQEGEYLLTVRAFAESAPVGELEVDVLVIDGAASRRPTQQRTALPEVVSDDRGLTLEVTGHESGHVVRLLPSGSADAISGEIQLDDNLLGVVLNELTALAKNGNDHAVEAERFAQTANLGRTLWSRLIPDELRQELVAALEHSSSVSILSDVQSIPWELLCPTAGDDKPFIVERIPLVRIVSRALPARQLCLARAAYVLPASPPTGARAELAAIRALLGDRSKNLGQISSYQQLRRLINGRDFDLLHIAAHNVRSRPAWDRIRMVDQAFTPYDLAQAQITPLPANSRRPLVFFNACNTSGGTVDAMQASWATAFLRAGTGAFIGSSWPVRSETAGRFAKAFYSALITPGTNLGEASLAARAEVQNGHDPTWLAYAVYGSAQSTVTGSKRE